MDLIYLKVAKFWVINLKRFQKEDLVKKQVEEKEKEKNDYFLIFNKNYIINIYI